MKLKNLTKTPSHLKFTKELKPIVIDKFRGEKRAGVASPLATTRVLRKNFFFPTDVKERNSNILDPSMSS
jgi:hypothetical protein